MRKLISFLGYTRPNLPYRDATYKFGTEEHTSKFAAAAMTKLFRPDYVAVLVTPQAKSQNFNDLKQDMLDNLLIEPVACDIPIGENATEFWKIFNAMTNILNDGDTVIFDITNGLRSLPVLGFIAAAYIKSIRKVEIEHLVYGAYDTPTPEGKTPVFDLTPFLTLLDWTTATNTFIQTGRAEQLTKLAQSFENQAVKDFANQMQTLSQELLTTRPVGVIQAASGFAQALAKVEVAVQQDPAMQPYQQLLARIKTEYSDFAIVDEPITKLSDAYAIARQQQHAFLEVQLEMIKWYLEKDLPIQAMTLAREWLVSLGVYHQKALNLFKHHDRDVINKLLNQKANQKNQAVTNQANHKDSWLSNDLALAIDQMVTVWAGIALEVDDPAEATNRVRNDIAHCGMDMANGRSAKEIAKQAKIICQRLYALLPTK